MVRVKCEVAHAIKHYYYKAGFGWFQKWTVEVDLNLIVTDTAGATPSVSFVTPLTNAVFPGISAITQNYALGVSAGANAQATRNETMSFGLAVKDLVNLPDCALPDNANLDSDLGIKQWVDEAFEPAANGLLVEGDHPLPTKPSSVSIPKSSLSATGPGAGPGAPTPEEAGLQRIKDFYSDIVDDVTKAPLVEEVTHLNMTLKSLKEKMTKEGDNYKVDPKNASDVLGLADEALHYIDLVQKAISNQIPKYETDADIKGYYDAIGGYRAQLNKIHNALAPSKPAKEKDPPVEALSHQVSFIVSLNAGISPNWTLARFRGPGSGGSGSGGSGAGSLFSASRARTNNLSIILGKPGSPVVSSNRTANVLAFSLKNVGF